MAERDAAIARGGARRPRVAAFRMAAIKAYRFPIRKLMAPAVFASWRQTCLGGDCSNSPRRANRCRAKDCQKILPPNGFSSQ